MKSNIAQTTRGPIEYTLRGEGSPVLICHGTSSDCFSTALAEPLVEAGFQVLTPSRPGYGRTPSSVGTSAAEAALGLIALLDKLKIRTCAVVAISGGGPTGVTLAAMFPERITRLVLAAAVTHPEERPNEPAYKSQVAFYGPMHSLIWGMLRITSRLSPRAMARQTLAIFSTHDPEDGLSKLSAEAVHEISRFYQGRSSRKGALNDMTHRVGANRLGSICQPTLVIHSREDRAVPFSHAEWSLAHIPKAALVEAGITGHFFWVDSEYPPICQQMIAFLQANEATGG